MGMGDIYGQHGPIARSRRVCVDLHVPVHDRSIPIVGAVVAICGIKSAVEEKGIFWGTADTVLDAIPLFGTAKTLAETLGGENLIGRKDEPSIFD